MGFQNTKRTFKNLHPLYIRIWPIHTLAVQNDSFTHTHSWQGILIKMSRKPYFPKVEIKLLVKCQMHNVSNDLVLYLSMVVRNTRATPEVSDLDHSLCFEFLYLIHYG